MATMTLPAPVHAARVSDEIHHMVCDCDEMRSLCGLDMSGVSWIAEGEEITCIVCLDLDAFDCPRCGT